MSVIENAIKKLQAARPRSAAARDAQHASAASRRREAAEAGSARAVTLNQEALRAAGLLPPLHQERELAQQFRQIKRPLINAALGRNVAQIPNGNLILVASATAGEGKTFTSLNLALSMRLEEDLTVLLLDGDVVNPRMTQILGLESEPGLLDVIRDPALPLASVILSTDLPGLSFLPAGRQDPNSTELLASARMREVVSELGGHDATRIVLFDSAPLVLTTESLALAELAGQILVVVRADQTPQHVVLEAVGSLPEGKPVSLALNQSMKQPQHGYYYQYGSTGTGPRD
jgi:protein-tyrosine kinase